MHNMHMIAPVGSLVYPDQIFCHINIVQDCYLYCFTFNRLCDHLIIANRLCDHLIIAI